jgi:hypothetical protein
MIPSSFSKLRHFRIHMVGMMKQTGFQERRLDRGAPFQFPVVTKDQVHQGHF